MASTLTTNMGLIVPGIGTEPGPTWGSDLNASLGILDQHNHSAGQGVQITPSGLNINGDLSIQSNNLTAIKTARFTSQSSSLAGASPNLGVIYVAGNELYYNDESGNVVQVTNAGSVNAGAGSITGLPSGTASASYSSGTSKFIWQSATSTPATMDGGSFIFREIAANAHGITVSSPASLAADYGMSWPAALPGSTVFLTLASNGNIGAATGSYPIDNATLTVSSNLMAIKDHGVTQVKKALMTSGSTATAGNFAVSSSSGTFATTNTSFTAVTNLSVTITTTGRPVQYGIQSIGGTGLVANENTNLGYIAFNNGGTSINTIQINGAPAGFQVIAPPAGFIDLSVNGTAGTYTYTVTAANTGGQTDVFNCVLYAFEI